MIQRCIAADAPSVATKLKKLNCVDDFLCFIMPKDHACSLVANMNGFWMLNFQLQKGSYAQFCGFLNFQFDLKI